MTVGRGERLGLIGPNGSGKSTFVNCLGGIFPRHSGEIEFDGALIDGPAALPARRARPRAHFPTAARLQEPDGGRECRDPVALPGSGGDRAAQARDWLQRVGLADKATARPRELTQVDLRRLELARALACRPKLLIADEAMAGLAHSEVDEILELLFAANAEGVAVIMIEHIMRAVTAFAERLVVFVAGRKIADGPTPEVLRLKQVEAAYLGE